MVVGILSAATLCLVSSCSLEAPSEGKVQIHVDWKPDCTAVEGVTFDLCKIPQGTLLPGGTYNEYASERPVEIASFWIANTPVTNVDYERFDPAHSRPEFSDEDMAPVTNVTWYEAKEYSEWLSARVGFRLQLPGSREWEFACLGGNDGPYPWGRGPGGQSTEQQRERAHILRQEAGPVAQHPPNAFGLYDMVGNVLEWSDDWWVVKDDLRLLPGDPTYDKQPRDLKVVKNCPAINLSFVFCECYYESGGLPRNRNQGRGFRLATSSPPWTSR